MASYAEDIMTAVTATLTGLTTTGANVFRGRLHALSDAEIPALSIYQGNDDVLDDFGTSNFQYVNRDLTVRIEAHVKTNSQAVDTLLNLIAREVYIAMLADHTQGKGYVLTTIATGNAEPVISGEGEKPTAMMTMGFNIRYRHTYADPGA